MSQKTGLQFATLTACLIDSLTHTGNETPTNTFCATKHIDANDETEKERMRRFENRN